MTYLLQPVAECLDQNYWLQVMRHTRATVEVQGRTVSGHLSRFGIERETTAYVHQIGVAAHPFFGVLARKLATSRHVVFQEYIASAVVPCVAMQHLRTCQLQAGAALSSTEREGGRASSESSLEQRREKTAFSMGLKSKQVSCVVCASCSPYPKTILSRSQRNTPLPCSGDAPSPTQEPLLRSPARTPPSSWDTSLVRASRGPRPQPCCCKLCTQPGASHRLSPVGVTYGARCFLLTRYTCVRESMAWRGVVRKKKRVVLKKQRGNTFFRCWCWCSCCLNAL